MFNLKFTKKDLLKLPYRQEINKKYSSLLVCKNGKNASGYASMLIVGLDNYNSLENSFIISKYCESIQWKNADNLHFASDMHFQSGIIHFFSKDASFQIIGNGSMLSIYLNNDCEFPF